ncbi:cytochrome P450 [Streptomyces sp. NPDC048142]|uniref:cytochrome P450 n=1 Tax=Streptomyces sp. NPDC048142 TaxID=3365501 RepID=UPI0037133E70
MNTHPPSPPARALPGLLRKFAVDRLGMMSDAAALGDAVRISIGPRKLYIFNHPDHAKHILADNSTNYHKGIGLIQSRRVLGDGLLTSDGETWRTQRRTLQPAFKPGRINRQTHAVAQEATRLVTRLRAHAGHGPVDILQEITALTLGVLGRTLLDSDLTPHHTLAPAFEKVQDQAMLEMVSQGTLPPWLPLPPQNRFRKARRELHRIADQLITDRTTRITHGEPADDALSLIIEAARLSTTHPRHTRRQLREQLITLLLAGHETTASTLGWTLHLLERHPETHAAIREETRNVLGDRTPNADDLHRLPQTTMAVQEAMRLYPPVWLLPRKTQQPDQIGPYTIPAKADILISPYTIHRHPHHWKNPHHYNPQRFTPQKTTTRHRYAYIPFGAGPHFCIGNNLAMIETIITTALITRDLNLHTTPHHQPTPTPNPQLSLHIHTLPMTITTPKQ